MADASGKQAHEAGESLLLRHPQQDHHLDHLFLFSSLQFSCSLFISLVVKRASIARGGTLSEHLLTDFLIRPSPIWCTSF